MRPILKGTATLCLVLTLWSAVAAVAHHHASVTDSLKCSVCATVHSASPNAISSLPKVNFVPESTVQADSVTAKLDVEPFALSVRPHPEA